MEIAFIKYGNEYAESQEIFDWCGKLNDTAPLIINNKLSSLMPGELPGDNSFFEFSGYQIAVKSFKTNGPFLIINDTLFKHHLPVGWIWLINKAIQSKLGSPTVWGDHRNEKIAFPEKEKIFLASWIFFLPDRHSLEAFGLALDTAIKHLDQPLSDPYQKYIHQWLKEPSMLSGWKGRIDEQTYQRKFISIQLEHALSRSLSAAGLLRSFGQITYLYRLIRILERIQYRFNIFSKKG
jgi:hypothetical protein